MVRTRTNGKSANSWRNKTTFKAAAAVCGSGSLGRCRLLSLVPCYPVCHIVYAFVNRGFPGSVIPPPPIPLGATRCGCVAIPAQCCFALMPLSHEAFFCFEDSAIPLSRLLSCNRLHLGPHPKTNLEWSVGPMVASDALWLSSRHRCQLVDCPPGLRPSLPVTFPSITRLGNHLSFRRATPPAKKSRRLRMFVLMLSHHVFFRAFGYGRVV